MAAVDTNLKRVLSRWHGDVLNGQALSAIAAADLADDAASWNQAMMDLGATMCRPRKPSCSVCPVAAWCAGPETYEPPRPQPRFEGSLRQIRGAVMRRLVAGDATFDEIVATSGFRGEAVEEALAGLIDDGLIVEVEEGFTLTE